VLRRDFVLLLPHTSTPVITAENLAESSMPQDHFVAQTYLKAWCDPASRDHMHAYRKSDLKRFPCRPYDVCRERDGDIVPAYLKDPAALAGC
jgi:hypothetical protein